MNEWKVRRKEQIKNTNVRQKRKRGEKRLEKRRGMIKNENVQAVNQMDRYTVHVLSLAVL